jgi:hypothetical protein
MVYVTGAPKARPETLRKRKEWRISFRNCCSVRFRCKQGEAECFFDATMSRVGLGERRYREVPAGTQRGMDAGASRSEHPGQRRSGATAMYERYSVAKYSSGSLERSLVSVARHFLIFTALFVFCASTATAAELPTIPCELPGVARSARCGVLDVLEDPNKPGGRRLPIHVAVVPASSGKALTDPIVVLMGGPGEDAIGAAEFYAAQFEPLLKDRDLLLVDQRGTGQSAALNCELFPPGTEATSLHDFFPLNAIESAGIACRRSPT